MVMDNEFPSKSCNMRTQTVEALIIGKNPRETKLCNDVLKNKVHDNVSGSILSRCYFFPYSDIINRGDDILSLGVCLLGGLIDLLKSIAHFSNGLSYCNCKRCSRKWRSGNSKQTAL